MDVVAAIASQKHSNSIVVTASADNISFQEPIALGNVVTLKAQVTRAFNSSMEVFIEVTAEDIPARKKVMTHRAYFTFVAVDENNKPSRIPELVPETTEEIENFKGALRRRQLRLVLAKRMKPEDALELKSIFNLD
jgi:acyl-CoA hydrolase